MFDYGRSLVDQNGAGDWKRRWPDSESLFLVFFALLLFLVLYRSRAEKLSVGDVVVFPVPNQLASPFLPSHGLLISLRTVAPLLDSWMI